MTKNVAIVGAGQLGSRHLQGLALCDTPLAIYLVDPSPASLEVARERYGAMPAPVSHSLSTVARVADLPADLELVIVACTANYRFGVYKDLLEHTRAKTILLEKVLFQDLDEYPAALELDAASETKTIVNLAKRFWPFFHQLRDGVMQKDHLEIAITGSMWGLGCNAVHHVDICEFIWGCRGQTMVDLDPKVIDSKRPGFHEFTGRIETRQPGGGRLTQVSWATGNAPFMITARAPEMTRIWDVTNSRLYSADASTNWTFAETSMQAPFQSNLTTTVVNDVLAHRACNLPDLATSAASHVETLTGILDAARIHGHDFGRICPVT